MPEKFLIEFTMKKTLLVAFFSTFFFCAFAQDEKVPSKFFAGGSFGLSLGRYTFINLNPQVGYRFNRLLGAGLGMNLVYASQKEKDIYGNDYSKVVQGITGLNTFLRVYPIRQFLIQVQPEANYIFGKVIYYQPMKQTFKLDAMIVPSVLVGGGLITPAGNGEALFTLMYDVLQDRNSPYGNRPVVNVGYNINF